MVAIRQLDVTTGESHFITPPVTDDHRTEVEEEAERATRREEGNGRVYFAVQLVFPERS